MKNMDDLDPQLRNALGSLEATPQRDPAEAARRRQAFLLEAANISREFSAKKEPISHAGKFSFARYFQSTLSPSFRNLGSTLLIIIFILFGSSGLSVVAAQSSLPDQILYPVKTLSEELRYKLADSTNTAFRLEMLFYNRRLQEVQAMEAQGKQPPDSVRKRLNTQFIQTVSLMEKKADPLTPRQLEEFHTALHESEMDISQMELEHTDHPNVSSIHGEIKKQLGWVEAGIQNPNAFNELFDQIIEDGELPAASLAEIPEPKETQISEPDETKNFDNPESENGRTGSGESENPSSENVEENKLKIVEGGDSDPTDEQKCFSASGQPTSCDDKQVKKPEIQGIPTPVSPANEDEPSYDNGSKPSNPEDDSGSKNGENSDDEQPPRSEDKPDQPSGDSDDD